MLLCCPVITSVLKGDVNPIFAIFLYEIGEILEHTEDIATKEQRISDVTQPSKLIPTVSCDLMRCYFLPGMSVRVSPNLGQIGPKWDKSGTF